MVAFAEIRAIYVPSTAAYGERVNVQVQIKNLYTAPIGIRVVGDYELGQRPWPPVTFPNPSLNVDAGSTVSFAGYFDMPNKTTIMHIYSYYYGVDGVWHPDDEDQRTITLGGVTYVFSFGVPTVSLA